MSYENFAEKIDIALKIDSYKDASLLSEKYPIYFKEYVRSMIGEYLQTPESPRQKERITELISGFENKKGDHYLHDEWTQYQNWTDDEKKRKLLLDETVENCDEEKKVEECLNEYLALNDVYGIFQTRMKLVKYKLFKAPPETIIEEIEKVAEYAKQNGLFVEKIQTHNIKALANLYQGKISDALNELDHAEVKLKENGDQINHARTLLQKGEIYSKAGYYDEAKEYFSKALKTFRISGYGEEQASVSIGLGNLSLRQKDPQNALTYFEEADSIYERLQNKSGQAKVFNNLGVTYDHLQKTEKASEYFKKSMELAESIQDPLQEAETGNNLGSYYLKMNETDKAIETYRKTIQAAKKSNSVEVEIQALHNLGLAYYCSSKKNEAMSTLSESLSLSRRTGHDSDALETSLLLGKIYLSETPKQARPYLEISKELAKKLNQKDRVNQVEELLKTVPE